MKKKINNFNIIVEDLGDIHSDIIIFREKLNFPGMCVLQFEINAMETLNRFNKESVLRELLIQEISPI